MKFIDYLALLHWTFTDANILQAEEKQKNAINMLAICIANNFRNKNLSNRKITFFHF